MRLCVRDIAWTVLIAAAMMTWLRPVHAEPPLRPGQTARVVIEQAAGEPIVLELPGQRIKEDGRLRFVGSIDRGGEESMVQWNFVCDPNPNGGASIEGVFEIVGAFDGSIRLELPLDPIVDGLVALKTNATMRAQTNEAGVAISIPAGESAWSVLVDRLPVIRHGQGRFSIERRSAGVTSPRTWSSGEEEFDDPIVVKQARDTLAIRACCTLAEGRSVMFTGKVQLIGDPENFRFREELALEESDSWIPRRSGGISIIVPGAGNGGRRGPRTTNKPPAVVRPSIRGED